MQIRTGSCDVTNGSNVVVASALNDWTLAAAGHLFSIPTLSGAGVLYTIASTITPELSPSGKWELRLASNYAGATAVAQGYEITKDFTPNLALPLPYRGDTDTAAIISRAFTILDQAVAAINSQLGLIDAQITLAYIADGGLTGAKQTALAAAIAAQPAVDALLCGGDNHYFASGTFANAWAVYDALGLPIYPARGNHDDDRGTVNAEYAAKFPALARSCRYYDVILGNGLVHLFVLHSGKNSAWADTEPDGNDTASAQHAWFVETIAASTARWKIVMFHHPFVTSGSGANRVVTNMDWRFEQYGVDLILTGHTHITEILTRDGLMNINNGSTSDPKEHATRALQGSGAADTNLNWQQETKSTLTLLRITRNAVTVEIKDVALGTTLYQGGLGDATNTEPIAWDLEALPPGVEDMTLASPDGLYLGTMPRSFVYDRGIRVSFATATALATTVDIYAQEPGEAIVAIVEAFPIAAGVKTKLIPLTTTAGAGVIDPHKVEEGTQFWIKASWAGGSATFPFDGLQVTFLGRFHS